jgi:hypothetical protein
MKTITEYEAIEMTLEFLNETCDPVQTRGYEFEAGNVLKEMDPIAFRQEMLNYMDAIGRKII